MHTPPPYRTAGFPRRSPKPRGVPFAPPCSLPPRTVQAEACALRLVSAMIFMLAWKYMGAVHHHAVQYMSTIAKLSFASANIIDNLPRQPL